MAKESAMVQIETKITCVCDSIRLMAIVGFQLRLLCADAICAMRSCFRAKGRPNWAKTTQILCEASTISRWSSEPRGAWRRLSLFTARL